MNNFGALRLFAAVGVLLGHSFVVAGEAAPRWFGMEVHTLAVHVFFIISGYLMAGSWTADPSLPRFWARRALRIMPALLVVVVLTVVVIGPAFTTLPLPDYARHGETRTYLWNMALAPYFALPGVFQDGRPFTAVNGSLWTLPVEVMMYALVPLLAAPARVVRFGVLPIAVLGLLGMEALFAVLRTGQITPVVYWTSIPFALRFGGDFVLASAIRLWGLERFLGLQASLLLLVLLGVLPEGPVRGVLLLLVLPYLVLSFALARRPLLPGVGRRWDLSYGIYLWGGPMQQVTVSLAGAVLTPWALLGWSLAPSAVLAALSWWAVERPCLRLKPHHATTLPRGVNKLVTK